MVLMMAQSRPRAAGDRAMPASTFPIPFPTERVLVGGEWRAGAAGATLALEDPSDDTELCRIARGSAADIDAAVRGNTAFVILGALNAEGLFHPLPGVLEIALLREKDAEIVGA